LEKLKEENRSENEDVHVMIKIIILKWVLRKCDAIAHAGFFCLRVGTSGKHL